MPTLQTEHLKPLACYVAGLTGRNIAGNRPIVGEDIFTCETGLHLQGLRNDPETYEPFAPEKVAGRRQLLLGPKCGRRAILARLDQGGDTRGGKPAGAGGPPCPGNGPALKRPLSEAELRRLLTLPEQLQYLTKGIVAIEAVFFYPVADLPLGQAQFPGRPHLHPAVAAQRRFDLQPFDIMQRFRAARTD